MKKVIALLTGIILFSLISCTSTSYVGRETYHPQRYTPYYYDYYFGYPYYYNYYYSRPTVRYYYVPSTNTTPGNSGYNRSNSNGRRR